MNTFFPKSGSEAEWNAAYYRLEDYLRALQVTNRVHQSQIILRLLQMAAQRHALDPDKNPTTLAMEEARVAMDQWFNGILDHRERISVTGLISFRATDAVEQTPLVFLADEVPSQFRRQMQENDIRAGPDLQVSNMVPRPIDVTPLLDTLGFSDRLEKTGRAVIVATAVFIIAIVSLSVFFLRH